MIDWEKVWREFDEWRTSIVRNCYNDKGLWSTPNWDEEQAKIQELVDEEMKTTNVKYLQDLIHDHITSRIW